MLLSTADADRGSKLRYKYKLYLKSNNKEFSSGIAIKLSALKISGDTPYIGLYGEAPPERGTIFKLRVYKRVGIHKLRYIKG